MCNYKLRPEFRSYFIDHRWIELRQVIEPTEIIATLIRDNDELLRVRIYFKYLKKTKIIYYDCLKSAGVKPIQVVGCGSQSQSSISESSQSDSLSRQSSITSQESDDNDLRDRFGNCSIKEHNELHSLPELHQACVLHHNRSNNNRHVPFHNRNNQTIQNPHHNK